MTAAEEAADDPGSGDDSELDDVELRQDTASGPAIARRLFAYVTRRHWSDYRAVMGVFAGTFFSEFTPEEVAARLAATGHPIDHEAVADRLEQLRAWGNLTVSSSVGSPTSLDDYYRRRNRYLITRAGQEVHDVVEDVLGRVDEVRDVSTGRLRALLQALRALHEVDVAQADPVRLADLVRAVFDPHEAFTTEITQFFAAINQWQSRYDLAPEEFSFFAEVLVGYVGERLDEIERTSRPIGRLLEAVLPDVPAIVARANRGLAARVDDAGLGSTVQVSRARGSVADDWEHLAGWFVGRAGPSRIERLTGDAVSAIRTLTMNLTRLSRVGVGASSRRGDFLRLATMFAAATADEARAIAVAAFGLHPTTHWGREADDGGDPVSTATPWSDAPRAMVPISLRERGDTTNRGSATPMRDCSREQAALRDRRARELATLQRIETELLADETVDGRQLSVPALAQLQELLGRALQTMPVHGRRHNFDSGAIRCTIEREPGVKTSVASPEGVLTLYDLRVTLGRSDGG